MQDNINCQFIPYQEFLILEIVLFSNVVTYIYNVVKNSISFSYLNYGPFGSFGPSYDSRAGLVQKY